MVNVDCCWAGDMAACLVSLEPPAFWSGRPGKAAGVVALNKTWLGIGDEDSSSHELVRVGLTRRTLLCMKH